MQHVIASLSVISTWLQLNSEPFCQINYDEDFGTFGDSFPAEFKSQSASAEPRSVRRSSVWSERIYTLLLFLAFSLSVMVLLRARRPLAQAVSFIRPTEEVRKGALHTAACLLSYFLTHARSLAESWGLFRPRWVNSRWTGGDFRATSLALKAIWHSLTFI